VIAAASEESFVAGNKPSIADCTLTRPASSPVRGITIDPRFNVARWRGLQERPSAQA
jgi:hypothetical protein